MQTTTVSNGVKFAYRDSGPPSTQSDEDYVTIILFHGHSFHSGTMLPMIKMASSQGYRIICPNRRLYPGSTDYTQEEVDAFRLPTASNSAEDHARVYIKQGEYLLQFVDNMIKEHGLKKVIISGWSLGSGFLSAMACSMGSMGKLVKERVRGSVRALVWNDPPSAVHGIPDPPSGGWTPLYDASIPEEQRPGAFLHWVTQYFPHPHNEAKDWRNLIYTNTPPAKRPATFSNMSPEDLLTTMVDVTAGERGDSLLATAEFQATAKVAYERALFSRDVRDAWGGDRVKFGVVYGEESAWTVLWAAWKMEEKAEEVGLPVKVVGMPGVNHFGMQDDTKAWFDAYSKFI